MKCMNQHFYCIVYVILLLVLFQCSLVHMQRTESVKFQFVDLKQNTVPYIAVMRFGAWLLIFLRKEQYRMKLVLAEKPSVAMSLSKVIGANQRGDGYMEGNGYLVSWCVGHLVELSQPEAYDEKYARWKYDDLPILPEHWQYQVSASTKKQFGILKKLMQRKDVESLICATDAGREGELIFRLVYQQAGCKKPVERLWISSMEDSAIREGFQKLRPGTEYDALYEAALCRERADWIVGINATRLFSCLYGQTLNVGRVMTPTLAMVVMRDAAIRAFKPEPFYSAELRFRDFQAGSERMKAKAEAEKLVAECCQAGSAIITKVEQKEKAENGSDKKLPRISELNAEYAMLLERKKSSYAEYRKTKSEMQDWLVAQKIVQEILKEDEQKKEQLHEQEVRQEEENRQNSR